MKSAIARLSVGIGALMLAAGCAAPLPLPFDLVDSTSKIQRGTIFPQDQRIEVTIDGHAFRGFYLVATGFALSQSAFGWHYYPGDTITTFSSNSARAHLTADNGQRLFCDFLLEFRRAVGECRAAKTGETFRLIANEN